MSKILAIVFLSSCGRAALVAETGVSRGETQKGGRYAAF